MRCHVARAGAAGSTSSGRGGWVRRAVSRIAPIVALALLGACSDGVLVDDAPLPEAAPTTTLPSKLAFVTPGETLEALAVVHVGHVMRASLAYSATESEAVKSMALEIVDEHQRQLAAESDAALAAGLTRDDSPLAQELAAASQQDFAALRGVTGADLDRQFLITEQGAARRELTVFDQTLVPSARSNRAMAGLLASARVNLTEQAERLRALEATLMPPQ